MMPRLNDKALAEPTVKLNPNLKVTYLSGYPANALFQALENPTLIVGKVLHC